MAHRETEQPMTAVTECRSVPWYADWDTPVLTYAVSWTRWNQVTRRWSVDRWWLVIGIEHQCSNLETKSLVLICMRLEWCVSSVDSFREESMVSSYVCFTSAVICLWCYMVQIYQDFHTKFGKLNKKVVLLTGETATDLKLIIKVRLVAVFLIKCLCLCIFCDPVSAST